MRWILCLVVVLLTPLPLAGQGPRPTLEMVEYRVRDASSTLVRAYDQATDDAAVVRLFAEVEPRYALSVPTPPGELVVVDQGGFSGSVSVKPADEGMFEVTLGLRRFFNGSALLIAACEPHVVGRFRVRVQGRTQLTVRAVRVDPGTCIDANPWSRSEQHDDRQHSMDDPARVVVR